MSMPSTQSLSFITLIFLVKFSLRKYLEHSANFRSLIRASFDPIHLKMDKVLPKCLNPSTSHPQVYAAMKSFHEITNKEKGGKDTSYRLLS